MCTQANCQSIRGLAVEFYVLSSRHIAKEAILVVTQEATTSPISIIQQLSTRVFHHDHTTPTTSLQRREYVHISFNGTIVIRSECKCQRGCGEVEEYHINFWATLPAQKALQSRETYPRFGRS